MRKTASTALSSTPRKPIISPMSSCDRRPAPSPQKRTDVRSRVRAPPTERLRAPRRGNQNSPYGTPGDPDPRAPPTEKNLWQLLLNATSAKISLKALLRVKCKYASMSHKWNVTYVATSPLWVLKVFRSVRDVGCD